MPVLHVWVRSQLSWGPIFDHLERCCREWLWIGMARCLETSGLEVFRRGNREATRSNLVGRLRSIEPPSRILCCDPGRPSVTLSRPSARPDPLLVVDGSFGLVAQRTVCADSRRNRHPEGRDGSPAALAPMLECLWGAASPLAPTTSSDGRAFPACSRTVLIALALALNCSNRTWTHAAALRRSALSLPARMVQPVLRALQWRLEEAAEERQALEATPCGIQSADGRVGSSVLRLLPVGGPHVWKKVKYVLAQHDSRVELRPNAGKRHPN